MAFLKAFQWQLPALWLLKRHSSSGSSRLKAITTTRWSALIWLPVPYCWLTAALRVLLMLWFSFPNFCFLPPKSRYGNDWPTERGIWQTVDVVQIAALYNGKAKDHQRQRSKRAVSEEAIWWLFDIVSCGCANVWDYYLSVCVLYVRVYGWELTIFFIYVCMSIYRYIW